MCLLCVAALTSAEGLSRPAMQEFLYPKAMPVLILLLGKTLTEEQTVPFLQAFEGVCLNPKTGRQHCDLQIINYAQTLDPYKEKERMKASLNDAVLYMRPINIFFLAHGATSGFGFDAAMSQDASTHASFFFELVQIIVGPSQYSPGLSVLMASCFGGSAFKAAREQLPKGNIFASLAPTDSTIYVHDVLNMISTASQLVQQNRVDPIFLDNWMGRADQWVYIWNSRIRKDESLAVFAWGGAHEDLVRYVFSNEERRLVDFRLKASFSNIYHPNSIYRFSYDQAMEVIAGQSDDRMIRRSGRTRFIAALAMYALHDIMY